MSPALIMRWLVLAAVLAGGSWIILTRLSLTYDLAFFLPQPVTDAQRVLIDRVGQGPGSQMLFVTLPGATVAARDELAQHLRALPGVHRVLPQHSEIGIDAIPQPLLSHRYLLADVDTSEAGLRRALQARLRDLAAVDDPGFLELVAADPHLATVNVLESLGSASGEPDLLLDGETPYLVLETTPPAFNLGAQQDVLQRVRDVAGQVVGSAAELYGAGAYGVRLQAEVRRESTLFSVAASLALAGLLWITYRSVRAPLLAALPLAAGAVAGLAALALLFPAVHGITLAFGFTLMGVSVDYAMHVMSHVRGGRRDGLRQVWPTLALSVTSSALAFLAFTLSGSRGLLQLGAFSATGVLVAAFCAWLVLPHAASGLQAAAVRPADAGTVRVRLRFWPLLGALALAAVMLADGDRLWNDDLASLTPVPAEVLAVDRRLRMQSGAPDIRHLVVSRGPDQAEVLARATALRRLLEARISAGRLDGYRSVTALVPDPRTQARRRAALAPQGLAERLTAAAEGLPLRAAAFQPFVAAVERSVAASAPLTAAAYRGSELESVVDAMLYRDDTGWVALTFLTGLRDPQALAELLTTSEGNTLVDLQAASRSLLATYRDRLLQILAGALVLVIVVLALALRAWRRLLWVVGTTLASLGLTVAAASLLLGSLSLFDLVAATLVAGLGLDYALFFSRPTHDARAARDTVHALTVCFASTAVVFAMLAASAIPVLHGIGATVAAGVVAAYALAFIGRSVRPAT